MPVTHIMYLREAWITIGDIFITDFFSNAFVCPKAVKGNQAELGIWGFDTWKEWERGRLRVKMFFLSLS